jgi:hypothetical protein
MKQGLTTAQIVMLVVLAVVVVPIVGFVLLVLAYAMMHDPPRDLGAVDAKTDDAASP